MEKNYPEEDNFNLRLIVIYTGDVESAEAIFETNCITLRIEQAFLSHIDAEVTFNTIHQKVLSGVIVASDKFIDSKYMDQIRRRINMTQLGQLYEKEKIEYGNQKARETSIKEKTEMALKMLNRGIDIIDIMAVTELTEAELLRLQNENAAV